MGLWGIIFSITGFVVGVSIFIVPGKLIIIAGPAVILAYAIAGGMAILNCFVAAQIGTILPAEGGSFVAITRLISPFFGFMMVWVLLVAVIVANAFLAYGFAEYFVYFTPDISKKAIALGAIVFFAIINILGSTVVVRFQGVLVVVFLLTLAIFVISGVPHFDSDNLHPFMPNGFDSVYLAATMAYFSFGGFVLLLEIGGEIKNPSRNVPLGLGISFLIVMVTYISVSLILTGTDVDVDYATAVTPVLEVAKTTLPGWLVDALVISIVAAAGTTINSLILGYSRDILVLSKAKIFPEFLSHISNRFGTPVNSILAFTILSILAVLIGTRIEDFIIITVIGLMIQQMFLSVCLVRIPSLLGKEYENAKFKLSKPVIYGVSILLFIISAMFILINIKENLVIVLFMAGILGAGILYYMLVSKYWSKRNVSIRESSLKLVQELEKHYD